MIILLTEHQNKIIKEYTSQGIVVYHGSNNFEGNFTIATDNVGWFTDSYDYALSQGNEVHEFIIKPNKILTSESVLNIKKEDLFLAVHEIKSYFTMEMFDKIYPKFQDRINKYHSGTISSKQLFDGIGGYYVILKLLKFDVEILNNPYNNDGSKFYVVFNENIITQK